MRQVCITHFLFVMNCFHAYTIGSLFPTFKTFRGLDAVTLYKKYFIIVCLKSRRFHLIQLHFTLVLLKIKCCGKFSLETNFLEIKIYALIVNIKKKDHKEINFSQPPH